MAGTPAPKVSGATVSPQRFRCAPRSAGGSLRERTRPCVAVVHLPDPVPSHGARHGLCHGQRDQAARQRPLVRVPAPPWPLRSGAPTQARVAVLMKPEAKQFWQTDVKSRKIKLFLIIYPCKCQE